MSDERQISVAAAVAMVVVMVVVVVVVVVAAAAATVSNHQDYVVSETSVNYIYFPSFTTV
jgi:hypothetical protein